MKNSERHKFKQVNRRTLLACSALGSMALILPGVLMAQTPLVTTSLRGNLYLISGAGCNVVVSVGSDDVVVVDGGLQEFSALLEEEISRLAEGKPITALFNTNWRPEHTGLNHSLGPQGVSIIAHENTRLWQNNDFYVDWQDTRFHPLPGTAQANKTFYTNGSIQQGNETIEYGLINSFHTDGDIYIHFKESNVLVTGDMLTVGTYPLLDYTTGGWIGGAQLCTTALLEKTDPETLVVPALGSVQRQGALQVQQQMLDLAYEQVANAYRSGLSLEQFMATNPLSEFDQVYGDSALFTELLYRGTWYHVTSRAVPGII